jgi:membrane-bound serine protease (ClpP class)
VSARRRRALAALAGALMLAGAAAGAGGGEPRLARIVVDGGINPAVAQYVRRAITRAAADDAVALVIQLDTPGGLLQSARAVVKDILAAPLPIVVYVAPSGAVAGSAGVFITEAAHVAAMAPGTSIGAAHPVGGQGEDIPGTLGKKLESSTASFSEALARQRGRNVDWAGKAVRRSVSIASDEAARIHVVDLVARDLDDLAAHTKDRTVDVAGSPRSIDLSKTIGPDGHVRVVDYEMRFAERLLDVLANPNVAYLLMTAGLLGLYVELTHPGLVLPGVAGTISLLLALTALHVLSVNYGGLALLLLGAGLLVAEAFLPTFGVLGAGGLAAFVLGSLFLFDTEGTGLAVARSLIFGTAGALAVFALVVGTLVMRTRRRRPVGGHEGMLGTIGEARQRLDPRGTVLVRGEYWTATSEVPVQAGQAVEITGVDGLTLRVRPAGTPRP